MNIWSLNLILVTIGVLGALADVWVYRWARAAEGGWGVAAVVASLGSLGCFAVLLRSDTRSFSTIFMLSSIAHILVALVADVVFWGTRLNRTEWMGIVLAVLACLLLEQRHDAGPVDEETKKLASDPISKDQKL